MVKLILTSGVAIAIIFLTLLSFHPQVGAAPYGVGKYNENVPYGSQTQLTISTSGAVSFSLTPSDAGTLASASGTVTVVSTDVLGYNLYVRSLTTSAMTNGAASIAASANGSPASLAVDTWGYNLDGSSNFTGMTLSDVLIRSATQPYSAGDVTTVTYGARISNAKPAGSYSASVLYTAVPQTH